MDPVTGIALPGAEEIYPQFFSELREQVVLETGEDNRSFAIQVAETAGVSLADWLRAAVAGR